MTFVILHFYFLLAKKLLIIVTKPTIVTVLNGIIIAATKGDKFPVTA
jgi:hypothetical protein